MGIGNLAVLHSRGLEMLQGIITTLEIPGDLSCPPVVCFTNPKQERTVCVTACMLLISDFRSHRERLELQTSPGSGLRRVSVCLVDCMLVGLCGGG